MRVTLYSKPGCCLCDDARALLEEWASEADVELDEIDIRRDPALFDQYRYRIPVIVVDGREALEGRIDGHALADALTS
jgi:glutaredoxin